jgi:dTMP kinase
MLKYNKKYYGISAQYISLAKLSVALRKQSENCMKGFFITFEGIDGSGKTTQINLLDKYLKDRGFGVVLTREPGGTALGDEIREILLNPQNTGMSSRAETLLFEASRAQLVEEVIKPSLEKGKIVICDRFFDSTIAYQGAARGLGVKEILDLSLWATSGLVPDLTFLITINVEICESRMKTQLKKPDRIENEKNEFKEKISRGYLDVAKIFKERFVIIDGRMEIESVFSIIKNKVDVLLITKKNLRADI